MGSYKNYLVLSAVSGEKWCYGYFNEYGKAETFARSLVLPDSPVLEIFGTNESPDTYLTGETLALVSASGEIIPHDILNSHLFKLTERIYKIIKSQDWTNEADSLTDLFNSMQTLDGRLNIIEYLTNEIEAMED